MNYFTKIAAQQRQSKNDDLPKQPNDAPSQVKVFEVETEFARAKTETLLRQASQKLADDIAREKLLKACSNTRDIHITLTPHPHCGTRTLTVADHSYLTLSHMHSHYVVTCTCILNTGAQVHFILFLDAIMIKTKKSSCRVP